MVKSSNQQKIFFLLILFVGVFLRFNNLNWDSNFHLHPDERFLTMVGNAMKIPSSLSAYLNPQISTLNPTNVGYQFYVYGVFPLILNKILAVVFNNDTYNAFTLQGRFLSALADLLVLLLVYKTAQLLQNNDLERFSELGMGKVSERNRKSHIETQPLFAAFFYAVAVLPIQLSHFFAVDSFLNLFMFASFYFTLKSKVLNHKPIFFLILSAVFFGLALASKITAIFILPLNLFFLIYKEEAGFFRKNLLTREKRQVFSFIKAIGVILLYLLVSYISLRMSDPYIFQSANFFDFTPNQLFVKNLQNLKSFNNRQAWYPPGVQWINKPPVIFSLVNLAVFGVGLPYFILLIIGISSVLFSHHRSKILNPQKITFFWVILFFLYQSIQYVKAMRYFNFLYPFLAIFAATGMQKIINRLIVLGKKRRNVAYLLATSMMTAVIIWPLMFSSVYLNKHSRVVASEWIYQNLQNNAIIAVEHWDDALPLPLPSNFGKQFVFKELPVFAADNQEKWRQMEDVLKDADYYILSSNRGWGSILSVPERYPRMAKFYRDLFAEKLSFKKVAEFTSYPKLCFTFTALCLRLDDQWADESFTVYDHPKVMIFKKT